MCEPHGHSPVRALRRTSRARHPTWTAPSASLTLGGSLLFYVHSHANHPGAARIDLHHAMPGTVGVIVDLSKGLASWLPGASPLVRQRLETAWRGIRSSLWSSAGRLF